MQHSAIAITPSKLLVAAYPIVGMTGHGRLGIHVTTRGQVGSVIARVNSSHLDSFQCLHSIAISCFEKIEVNE